VNYSHLHKRVSIAGLAALFYLLGAFWVTSGGEQESIDAARKIQAAIMITYYGCSIFFSVDSRKVIFDSRMGSFLSNYFSYSS
jgi:hypothetical protein